MRSYFVHKIYISTFLLLAGGIAFVLMGTLGMYHATGMEMNDHTKTGGCLFIGTATICKMNIFEHIASLQSMLSAIPQAISVVPSLALILSTMALISRYFFWSLPRKKIISRRAYFLEHPYIHFSNALKQAFSAGILHTKIYKSVN